MHLEEKEWHRLVSTQPWGRLFGSHSFYYKKKRPPSYTKRVVSRHFPLDCFSKSSSIHSSFAIAVSDFISPKQTDNRRYTYIGNSDRHL